MKQETNVCKMFHRHLLENSLHSDCIWKINGRCVYFKLSMPSLRAKYPNPIYIFIVDSMAGACESLSYREWTLLTDRRGGCYGHCNIRLTSLRMRKVLRLMHDRREQRNIPGRSLDKTGSYTSAQCEALRGGRSLRITCAPLVLPSDDKNAKLSLPCSL